MWRRPKLVRQNDGNDCGPAALATLALHHGQDVGLEKLRDLTATDRTGANLLSLVRTARSLGFSAKAIRCTADALPQLPMPAIAHLRDDEGFGHFVVVYGVKRGKVIVGDPAADIENRSLEQFTAQWTGDTVTEATAALKRHCKQFVLATIREIGQGSGSEHVYHVNFRRGVDRESLARELTAIAGLSGVELLMEDLRQEP